jgi:hypothetical protein
MITFNKLGNLGRLGNQMFQYASLLGISKQHGYEYAIPPKEIFGTNDEKVKDDIDDTIYDVFNIDPKNKGISSFPVLMEKNHSFDSNLFEKCPDNIDLMGYFQTSKYFENVEEEIRKEFQFAKEIKEVCEKCLPSDECISLHIRRGDYAKLQDYHILLDEEYYKKSLEHFSDDLPVIIFSDDPEWCHLQNIFSSDRFIISENNKTGIDLCLMAMCKYHIIANSSLSWWGSYLSDSKKTIAPKKWFNEKLGYDCSDKYLKKWIVI